MTPIEPCSRCINFYMSMLDKDSSKWVKECLVGFQMGRDDCKMFAHYLDPVCPHCGSAVFTPIFDEVDIGVGVMKGPTLYNICDKCGKEF
jgi:hypothetical protein